MRVENWSHRGLVGILSGLAILAAAQLARADESADNTALANADAAIATARTASDAAQRDVQAKQATYNQADIDYRQADAQYGRLDASCRAAIDSANDTFLGIQSRRRRDIRDAACRERDNQGGVRSNLQDRRDRAAADLQGAQANATTLQARVAPLETAKRDLQTRIDTANGANNEATKRDCRAFLSPNVRVITPTEIEQFNRCHDFIATACRTPDPSIQARCDVLGAVDGGDVKTIERRLSEVKAGPAELCADAAISQGKMMNASRELQRMQKQRDKTTDAEERDDLNKTKIPAQLNLVKTYQRAYQVEVSKCQHVKTGKVEGQDNAKVTGFEADADGGVAAAARVRKGRTDAPAR